MIQVFKKGNKVILAGKVKEYTESTSQKGNDYVRIVLAGVTFDPDLELEVPVEVPVIFIDKSEGAFGPQMDAANVKKMKIREGSYIAVKASEFISEDGDITYFGSRAQYGGCRFNFRKTEEGNAAVVVMGVACKKGANEISVPINTYDKQAKENRTVWLTMKPQEGEKLDEHTFAVTGDGKRPLAAFVLPAVNEEKKDNQVFWSGKFTSCIRVN